MADIPIDENGKKKPAVGVFHVIKDLVLIGSILALVMIFAEIKIDVGVLKAQFGIMQETMKEILILHPRKTGGNP